MNTESDIVIRFSGVQKAFGANVIYTALDLDIRRGETITVMGGSGTGKSVMLKMLCGLMQADAGMVEVFGGDTTHLSERQWIPIRKRVSMLFQGGALFDSLTVRENIAYPLRVHDPHITDEEIDHIVAEKLALVGLPDTADMKPSDLSGGMKKRVGLARAIAMNPEVILWDEPTTGLDPINTNRINALIRRMQEVLHCTSVVVTHDMGSAFAVSDRIAFLYDKRIILTDTAARVHESDIPAVRAFIDGRFEGLAPQEKVTPHV